MMTSNIVTTLFLLLLLVQLFQLLLPELAVPFNRTAFDGLGFGDAGEASEHELEQ